jgi:UTP-glucose-1-phosphate uridylyltransferase
LKGRIETDYVYQSFDLKQYGIDQEIERAKPWGTAHAVLATRNAVKEPFCVINADDFYGRDAYEKMNAFLTSEITDDKFCMVGYEIGKTLSDFGSVSRGVCEVNTEGNLEDIHERTKVYVKDGKIVYEENGTETVLPEDTRVSMNFWGFNPAVFPISERMFKEFALANAADPKAEFFIPLVAEEMVKKGIADYKVIPTDSKWFGVTYKEDKPIVQASIDQLVKDGVYPASLWS